MGNRIGPSRTPGRGVARTAAGRGERAGRTARKGRAEGLTQVDTLPRAGDDGHDDRVFHALERSLEDLSGEAFTAGGFAEDLGRALAFLQRLPPGGHQGLRDDCARILQDEVAKAREISALRKGAPRL